MMVKGGVSLARALRHCGLSRRAYYKKRLVERGIDTAVAKAVTRISSERPTYGTRMLAHTAAYEMGRPVNRKKVRRICKILGIKGPKQTKKQAIRASKAKKVQFVPSAPYQLFEADITYIHCGVDGWRCCFNVVDVLGRKWLSYVFSPSARSASAVQSALDAVEGLSPDQIRGIRVRCDNGSQYTSGEFRKAMSVLGIKVEHIWVSTPQQNGHVESFHNTLKRDYIHTHDFESFQDAEAWLPQAHRDYNASRSTPRSGGCRPTSSSGSGKGTISSGRGPMAGAGAIGAKALPKYAPKSFSIWGAQITSA